MEFELSPARLPQVKSESGLSRPRVTRAWMTCVAAFVAGAVAATVINQYVGTIDQTSLRPMYIIFGILTMAGSFLWLLTIKSAIS
jgi:hypothetical protein